MKKHFICAQTLLLDSFKLAQVVRQSGFVPDLIIGVWRGGSPIGIAVHEYFEYCGLACDHFAIRTSLYAGIDTTRAEVQVDGLPYIVDAVSGHQKNVLLVDDVFDSGRSMQTVLTQLNSRLPEPSSINMKIACLWFKPARNTTSIKPDFYLHETDDWLIFPHELVGLSKAEIAEKSPPIAQLLDSLEPTTY